MSEQHTREIKFRAWDNKEKQWLLGYELKNLGGFSLVGETVLLGEWSHVIDPFLFSRNGYKFDDLKIMQYTGLEDKNGKEIYERDILAPCGIWIEKPTAVTFENGAFGLDGNSFHYGFEELNWKDLEVIGNIYENPELLK
jgi:hypothetical protein